MSNNIFRFLCNNDDFAMVRVSRKDHRRQFYNAIDFSKIDDVIDLEIISEVDISQPLGDISYFGGSFPYCFNKKAYNVLKSELIHSGIIKNAKIEENEYFVYWPTLTIDCLNVKESIIRKMPSGHIDLIKPVLISQKIRNETMFILKEKFQLNSLYVTSQVSDKLLENEITGYFLDEVDDSQSEFIA